MNYAALVSKPNLGLAWQRISTGRNLQYKRFFRSLYEGYAAGADHHVRHLHDRLRGTWEPKSPWRAYLPKPSGLQRPISLMALDDQVVLQSVSNLFASHLRERRLALQGSTVFSTYLSADPESMFFLRDWQPGYFAFQRACEGHFGRGLTWIAHFDIAAFYDSIGHDEMLSRLWPRGGGGEARRVIRRWMRAWSSSDDGGSLDHGIPQGPIASDFLAECFLLPLDEAMVQGPWAYLRYVDDVRIFAQTELEVQQATIKLDILCKELGLAPQGKKFKLGQAQNVADALGELPSIAPPDNVDGGVKRTISAERAERFMDQAYDEPSGRIIDRSKARYVWYRAPASRRILNRSLQVLEHQPEHIDAIAHYLSNHGQSKAAVELALRLLNGGSPYEYVRGELWHIVARMGTKNDVRGARPTAAADFDTAPISVPLQWGALALLLRAEREGLGSAWRYLKRAHPMVQGLVIEILHERYTRDPNPISQLMQADTIEGLITIPKWLVQQHKTHLDFGVKAKDLTEHLRIALRAVGIVRSKGRSAHDQIAAILEARFGSVPRAIWRRLLGAEFTYALRILRQADAVYDSHASSWLQLLDSFHDLVIRRFIAFLRAEGLPGGRRTINKNGDLIPFGSLLQANQTLTQVHSVTTDPFRAGHYRRNRLPGSHPYNKKGGARSTYLTASEKRRLVRDLRPAYDHLTSYFEQHS